MNQISNGRWMVIVPASPPVIALIAFAVSFVSKLLSDLAVLVLTFAFLLAPLVGAGTLVALCRAWLHDKATLRQPRVVAGVALSLFDIIIPLGLLLYLWFALKDAKLSF